MKRTYQGYAGGAAPAPSATPTPAVNPAYPYQPAQAGPYPGQPPLPAGAPPPPQPYQQPDQQQQQQQQYPGYGYAGHPAPHQQTQHGYNNYFAPQPATPAPAAAPPTTAGTPQQYSAYGYGGNQGQQHAQAAGQYPNYGYGAQPQAKPYANYQQVYQPQPGPAYPPQPYSHPPYTPGQPAAPPGPAPGVPQAYPYAGAPPPSIGAPVQPSPTGAPPYKRPRYEGAPAPPYQPQALPPALPPLASPAVAGRGGPAIRGGRGGFANVGRGRGGHHNGIGPAGGQEWEEGYAGAYGDFDGSQQRGGGPFRGGRAIPRTDFARGGGPVFAGPMRGGPVPGRGARGADRFPLASPKGPRGGVPSGPGGTPRSMSGPGPRSSPGAWPSRGGRGQKTGLRGRYDDRSRGILSPRSGAKTRTWGKDSRDYGDKDRREETSKRTLTDFRINALDVADLSWGWAAETQPAEMGGDSLEGVLNAAASASKPVRDSATPTPRPAADGEKKGKHGRDDSEDEDADEDGAGKKKVKSEAAAEEARKADEAAQTAPVRGGEETESAKTKESREEEHARNAEAAAKAVKELKVEDDAEDDLTASTSKGGDVDPVDEAIKRAEARSLEASTSAAPASQDVKPHSYSNPTIPAGRENSRLRIYFASPSATAVLDDGTDAHGHSRPSGKRKLSVGAQSAMSVDAKPLLSPSRGTTPMNKIKPVVEEEDALDGAPMTSEGSKDSASSTVAKAEEKAAEAKTNGTYPPEPYPVVAEPPTEAAESRAEEAGEEEGDDEEDAEPPMPEPSPDRISISYARNTRRLVVDSDVVEGIKVFRAEHKIEVVLKLAPAVVASGKFAGEPDEYRVCKGVLIESLDPEADDYVIIDRATLEASWQLEGQAESNDPSDDTLKHDPLLPPLHRLFTSPAEGENGVSVSPGFTKDTILIVAKLDTANPLTEAKWVRTGDVDSWISQMTGRVFDDGCGWRQKITVADPDPPPTIQHMLDTWLTTSSVGTIDTRQRFLDRHMSKDADNVIEILLRIVRGSSSSHHPSSTQSLISHQAATLRAPYPEQQTQVSLAVLALYRLAVDTAVEGGSVAKEVVIKKATDIVRSLPYRLAFGALDGIFKDEQQA